MTDQKNPSPESRARGTESEAPEAWAVLDTHGGAVHSVHIFKEDAERAAFGLGTVVKLKIDEGQDG